MHIESYAQLVAMSDEELIACFDATTGSTVVWTQFVRDELNRRQIGKATATIEKLTRWVVGLTIVNVILVAATLFVT
jgi:AraC-like DNA-binding protein